MPREGGWRPGARWARSDVAAAIDALPRHQRPPQRELGRTSEAAPAPFRGAGWAASEDEVAAQIAALPFHQRPPMRELSRRSEVIDHPFRAPPPPLRSDEGLAPAAPDPRAPRRSARDGHDGEAGYLAPPPLAQLAKMPAVQFPGEGPHPDHHGRCEPTAPSYGKGRFFQTGRTLGSVVARVCPEGDGAPGGGNGDPDEPPLVTARKIGSRVEIAAANPAARALGLAPGTALTQARAQVPGLAVRDADPDGDRADLARLATTLARRWTPTVAIAGDDGLLLDLTGVAHLHGGEERMARRLVRLLARHGVGARVAIADTTGAAWALSRFAAVAATTVAAPPHARLRGDDGGSTRAVRGGPQPGGNGQGSIGWADDIGRVSALAPKGVTAVPTGEHQERITTLPVAALRLEPATLELLARLGIDRVGQLLAMPRAPLVRRFGPALVMRLDQATGRAPEPLDPVVPAQPIAVEQRFAEPIATPEAIAHWLGRLMPQLAEALARAGLGARMVELVAARVDGVPQRFRLGFARATRDAAHLLRLAVRRIEEIEPGYGLDALALHVRRADPLGAVSLAPALAEEAAPDLGPLVDTLANRIGAGRLWRCTAVESDVPERSVAAAPPLDPPAQGAAPLRADDVRRLDARAADHPWHPRWPRPARLLRRPEPIGDVLALMPDQPPRRFTWRGRTHQVVRADGPERITGEWWRRSGERDAVRDYFQVEDEAGDRFWVYRRGDGVRAATGDLSWYIHGRFG